jgi:hypothetical protein
MTPRLCWNRRGTRVFAEVAALGATGSILLLLSVAGCSKNAGTPDALTKPSQDAQATSQPESAPPMIREDGSTPPSGMASVSFGTESLDLWPYTGTSFDGTPSDPVNLLFVGKADPVRIRAALLQLDGDRTAYGFPDSYPFNATWSDAGGDVQTTYANGEGWLGSVVQLQLGTYDPGRVHLRLFRTGVPFGDGGTWTIGAAHFEIMIPGTADHAVLSWELARNVVVTDLVRSGLLDSSTPMAPTDQITQTPSFRDIIPEIYNQLPEDLKAGIGGPSGTVTAPVPIPNDGMAMMLDMAGEAPPQIGTTSASFTVNYNITIPKPFCSEGPYDYVLLTGPVTLMNTTTVDATGLYQFTAGISGQLTVTPLDVTVSPPVPAGTPYKVQVGDKLQGALDATSSWAMFQSRRIAPQKGGSQMLMTKLRVGTRGQDSYSAQVQCP